jgi:hypothetical protein
MGWRRFKIVRPAEREPVVLCAIPSRRPRWSCTLARADLHRSKALQTLWIWVSGLVLVILDREHTSPFEMAKAPTSTPPEAQSPEFPSRRTGSQPPTRTARVLLWLLSQRSRLRCNSSGLSTPAPIATCSRRSLLPASWLLGLLFLALTSAPLPAAFRAAFVSLPVVLALLLIEALGSSTVAGKRAGMIADLIGVPRATRLSRPDRAQAALACTR